jgi:hypothetical protein
VTTDSDAAKPAIAVNQVTTDSGDTQTVPPATVSGGNRSPSASRCEPFREAIELGLSQGRNATGIWQDLISHMGFSGGYQTVKRLVRKLRGAQTPVTCAVTVTAPGEDYGECRVMVRNGEGSAFWTEDLRRLMVARYIILLGLNRFAVYVAHAFVDSGS